MRESWKKKNMKENILGAPIDNFLEQEHFDRIQQLMVTPIPDEAEFPWYFIYGYYKNPFHYETSKENELISGQFTHTFYGMDSPHSAWINLLNPILEKLQPISLWRIVANLLPIEPTILQNPLHTDMSFLPEEKLKQWTTSIFYLNTNDGYTIFEDGTKVESVANRMITFPANMKHTGTSCTNQPTRVLINFNYF